VGCRRFPGIAKIVDGERGEAIWTQYEQLHPTYPECRKSRGVDFTMVVLHPDTADSSQLRRAL
jgi:hypothetical protein